jgi:glycosyltransferase involved in cell wall biosynthesis/5'(3')-deoxyribonucleotidase
MSGSHRPVIAIDLDDTCADRLGVIAGRLRAEGLEVGQRQPARWDLRDWGVRDQAHFDRLHHEAFVHRPGYRVMPALPAAVEEIQRLRERGYLIRIVTGRLWSPRAVIPALAGTAEWLAEHEALADDVAFVSDKTAVHADVYIEDAPHFITDLRRAGREVIIMHARYNRHLRARGPGRGRKYRNSSGRYCRGSQAALQHSRPCEGTMSLKVLHVLVPEPPGEVGGADMHVHDLALAQRRSGMLPAVAERGSREFAARLTAAGVEVVSATALSPRAAVHFLAKQIAARRPDVVHAHGYDADYWAATAHWRFPRLFRAVPLVFTQHGVVADTMWHRCKTVLDALSMRAADGVIVCAPALAGRMQRWCPKGAVRYIPNGVQVPELPARDVARRNLGLPAEGFLLAYVGRLSPEKHPGRVLTLVADARVAGLAVGAVIAGSGPLRASLERLAETLGISGTTLFTGFTPAMGDIYGAVDALALLSDTETTSRVVIEAMSTRVPVIASAVGGVPELLDRGRAGRLVPPGDRMAALKALQGLIKTPGYFVDVAQRRAREHYLVAAMNDATREFYEHLLDSRLQRNGHRVNSHQQRA